MEESEKDNNKKIEIWQNKQTKQKNKNQTGKEWKKPIKLSNDTSKE